MSSFDVQIHVEEMFDQSYADWLQQQAILESEIDEINAMLSVEHPTDDEINEMAEFFSHRYSNV